jgi:hypothetical protein
MRWARAPLAGAFDRFAFPSPREGFLSTKRTEPISARSNYSSKFSPARYCASSICLRANSRRLQHDETESPRFRGLSYQGALPAIAKMLGKLLQRIGRGPGQSLNIFDPCRSSDTRVKAHSVACAGERCHHPVRHIRHYDAMGQTAVYRDVPAHVGVTLE